MTCTRSLPHIFVMMPALRHCCLTVSLAALSACQPGAGDSRGGSAIVEGPAATFSGIAKDETIRFVGTEPFWSGEIVDTQLRYATPENARGERVTVRRFAGNNGLAYTGTLKDQAIDLAITPGACSDGMSDRRFPYVATLKLGDEQRNGCAWTSRQPFTEPNQP